MSTDRELLELAAKAAGLTSELEWWEGGFIWANGNIHAIRRWNPLTHDGDALRLAVKLRLVVDIEYEDTDGRPATRCLCFRNPDHIGAVENHNDDPYAATRRAIVQAAAEIGRAML